MKVSMILALAFLSLSTARADEKFVPKCYCAPVGGSGANALCVEKNTEPHGVNYNCEAGFYGNASKCEAVLQGLQDSGRCL